jgi:hypothetical protein
MAEPERAKRQPEKSVSRAEEPVFAERTRPHAVVLFAPGRAIYGSVKR